MVIIGFIMSLIAAFCAFFLAIPIGYSIIGLQGLTLDAVAFMSAIVAFGGMMWACLGDHW